MILNRVPTVSSLVRVLIIALFAAAAFLLSPAAAQDGPSQITGPMSTGFNFVAVTEDTNIADATADIVFAFQNRAGNFLSYVGPGHPILNDPFPLAPGDGLMFQMNTSATWVQPLPEDDIVLNLVQGPNFIGWSGDAAAVRDAVGGVPAIKSVQTLNRATGGFDSNILALDDQFNSLLTMELGAAYWVLTDAPTTLTIPAGGGPGPETGPRAALPLATSSQEAEAAVVYIQAGNGSGSGFIVSNTQIVTNAHVVQAFRTVTVQFPGGEEVTGTVASLDSELDVAVVEVAETLVSGLANAGASPETIAGLRRLDWESVGTPAVGTEVFAWGYPFGRFVGTDTSATLSAGIVSAIQTDGMFSFIQTDAAVNPGNSGGPLVDAAGNALGINSFILAPSGQDVEGLNFAIDIAEHRDRIADVLAGMAPPLPPGLARHEFFGSQATGSGPLLGGAPAPDGSVVGAFNEFFDLVGQSAIADGTWQMLIDPAAATTVTFTITSSGTESGSTEPFVVESGAVTEVTLDLPSDFNAGNIVVGVDFWLAFAGTGTFTPVLPASPLITLQLRWFNVTPDTSFSYRWERDGATFCADSGDSWPAALETPNGGGFFPICESADVGGSFEGTWTFHFFANDQLKFISTFTVPRTVVSGIENVEFHPIILEEDGSFCLPDQNPSHFSGLFGLCVIATGFISSGGSATTITWTLDGALFFEESFVWRPLDNVRLQNRRFILFVQETSTAQGLEFRSGTYTVTVQRAGQILMSESISIVVP